MAEKKEVVLEILIDASNSVKTVGELKRSIKELTSAALAAGEGTALGGKFLKAAGEARDRMGDLNAQVNSFAGADAKIGSVVKVVGGLAAGFQAAQGAAALFGSSGKALEETMLKVQAATALAQGVQGIAGLSDSFAAMKGVAKDAFLAIKAGIGSTGIGLLVIALGAIVAYWQDIKAVVSGVSTEQQKINKEAQKNLEVQQEKLKTLGAEDNILKLQGKTEAQILALKVAQTDEAVAAQTVAIETAQTTLDAQVQAEARNKAILSGLLTLSTAPLQLVIDGIDYIYEKITGKKLLDIKLNDKAASFIFDAEETKAEGDKAIKAQQEALTKLKNDRAGYLLQINDINKKAADEEKQKAEDTAKQIAADKKDLEELNQKNLEADLAEALKFNQDYYDTKITQAKLNNEDTTQLEIAANETKLELLKHYGEDTIALENEIALQKKAAKDAAREKQLADTVAAAEADLAKLQGAGGNVELEAQIALENALYEQAKINNTNLELLETQHQQKIAALKKAAAVKEVQSGLKMAQDSLSAIQNLSDVVYSSKLAKVKKGSKEEEAILRKQFETNKKMQIASAIINGALAVTNIIATVPKADFGVSTAIMLVAAASATAASIAKIASTKFDSAGGSSSSSSFGGSGAPSTEPAPINPTNQPTTNLSGQGGGNDNSTKVYVTETDIKRVINRVNVIESRAQFR